MAGDSAAQCREAELAIRALIAAQFEAIRAKDLAAILAPYSSEAVVFDVKPPFRTAGVAAWRATWAACLPYFPVGVHMESRELTVRVCGDMAFAHWLWGITMAVAGEPERTIWMRFTGCYCRSRAGWQIEHEHCSSPYDPTTGRVVLGPPE